MGKFELNRDTSGREHFLIGKEQVADSKISGYVWMGKFELNRDTSGREHFLIGKEQVADSKISG